MFERWRRVDASWKFALGAFVMARVALSGWAFVMALLFPALTQNLDLFGVPVLASFDLATSERSAYSREVDGAALTFHAGNAGFVIDEQTASVWSLHDGRAMAGKFAGQSLKPSPYSVEDIFPYRGVAPSSNFTLALWQRFDTNWYLKIAQRGYSSDDGSPVYFPIYPLAIRVAGLVIGDGMFAAMLVSNLALVGVLVLLYRLTSEQFDQPGARRTIAYVLLFPTGFFLLAAYTEAVFLLFTLGAFFFARQNRWYLAALFGVLAALTRLQGVLLVVPLAWMWWQNRKLQSSRFTFYVLFLIPVATAVFFLFTNLSLLDSYVGELHARFVFPWENFGAAISLLVDGKASFIDIANLAATLGFGVMLIVVWKKLAIEYALYSTLMFLAPLFRMTTTQPLVSMNRYVLAMFPVFMLWGAWGKNSWVNRLVVYLAFPLQLYFSAQFVLWGWVG